jgi:FtsH-binding integral membrane protein
MKNINMTTLLQIAGLMHLGLICAGALMPLAVNLRKHIKTLPQFIRRLFWVYYSFIALTLVSFGTITFVFAETLANGSGLARAICIFLMVFWTIRLIAATFIFDVRPYLTNHYWKLGYQATNIVFAYLPVIYGWAAFKNDHS